ncbi:MAG TPA: MATE family efflux transporter, partial [Phycisphaerae bacterium]|nr:MATE family efflux transporter [Phycisphaerae bacterium]
WLGGGDAAILVGEFKVKREKRVGDFLDNLRAGAREADGRRLWGVGEVIRLAVPTVFNTISFTIMQFVDGVMVSSVGKETFSAQLGGGISAFTTVCFFIGLLGCVSTFAAQNLGAGRPERAARYAWQGLWLGWGAAALLAVVAIPAAPYLFPLFGHAPEVTRLETLYYQILVGGAVFSLPARALGAWFIGMHRPAITLVAGVAANVVNVAANYILIFGHLGFPAMGLAGAGLGMVAGFATEAAILGAVFLVGPMAREYATRRQWALSRRELADLLRIGSPAGAMFVGDILMWTIFMAGIIGWFGTEAIAATNILNRYWHLCFMPALGLSAAVSAIVGRYCGAGKPEIAWRRAHAGLVLVEAYMVTCGIVIWLLREPLVRLFNAEADPIVQAIATRAVIFILICQAFDALSVIFIGALRGAGDTLWPGAMQLALAYGVGLGGASLIAYLKPQWGIFGPWSAASGYVIVLGLVMWGRFLSGRWKRMTVVPAPAAVPEEVAGLPPV